MTVAAALPHIGDEGAYGIPLQTRQRLPAHGARWSALACPTPEVERS